MRNRLVARAKYASTGAIARRSSEDDVAGQGVPMMMLLLSVVAGVLALAAPARALFHLAEIDEAMSGVAGDPTLQFVEIRMLTILQDQVAHSRLTYFDCTGTTATVLLEVPANVPNDGADVRWVMASPSASAFLATFGITPDFTFPGGIDASCGNLCWGAPGLVPPNPPQWDPALPGNYVDCVAYGGYAGPLLSGQPVVAGPLGDGLRSLTRAGETFGLGCPTPENNAAALGGLAGCASTTTSSSTTTTTAPPPTDDTQLLDGTKLVLKDDPTRPAKRKLVAVSKDVCVRLGGGNGSVDDPRMSGANVRVVSAAGDGFDDTYRLPASGWTIIGDEGANAGYKYRDKLLTNGPVKSVTLKRARQLRLVAKGMALGHTLAANPDPVDVVLIVGGVRYCQRYGGTATFKTPKSFVAKLAPAPAACPP
jgi:hypothetical protein